MPAAPSSLIALSSRALGDAQARLRELAMGSDNTTTISKLVKAREALEAQQRRIMRANLAVIDADPAVLNNINQLTVLAGEIATAVQEIRNITRAINAATRILAAATQLLRLAAIV
jgi:hypothetical protein